MSTEGPRRPFSPHPDWFAAPETTGEFPVVSDEPAEAPRSALPAATDPFAALDAAAPIADADADAVADAVAVALADTVAVADPDADAVADAVAVADPVADADADADAVADPVAVADAAPIAAATTTPHAHPPPPLHRHLTTAARPDPDAPPESRPALLIATAASIVPPLLLYWFWLKRARFSLERALSGTLGSANDDPLLVLALFHLLTLTAFGAAWLVRDAARRRFVPRGRWLWAALLFPLGPLALAAYLAARPDLPAAARR